MPCFMNNTQSLLPDSFKYMCFVLRQWIIPEITGQRMPSNCLFGMESINNIRTVIFGACGVGIVEGKASNTLY